MTPADQFWTAIDAADFPAAETALGMLAAPLRRGSPTLREIAGACQFLESALGAMSERRTELAAELARLRLLAEGYRPRRSLNTWRISG